MKNIPFATPLLDQSEFNAVKKVLNSPILTHGPNSRKFELDFKKKFNFKFAHSVGSCTAALHLSYMALKLKKGDEVIVPNQTHVSTVHTLEILGAKPIFIDSNINDGNINVDLIESKINSKTKAITVVHYLGAPAQMEKVVSLCKKYKLYLIEDCALSIGAKFKNKFVGSFGDFACFSFYPDKHMTTADGGMLVCKNAKNYKKIKLLKGFGVDKNFYERKIPGNYDVISMGLNYRMNEISSALGIFQLKKLKNFIKKRRENYNFLKKHLKKIKTIKILNSGSEKKNTSSYYCLTIILNKHKKNNRFEIIKKIKSFGIGTSIHYPKPVSDFKYYKKKYKISNKLFPIAKQLSYQSINLPVGPHLSKKQLIYIASKVQVLLKS